MTIREVIAVLFGPQIQEQSSEATSERSVSVEVVDKSLQDGEAASKVNDLTNLTNTSLTNTFTLTNEQNSVLHFILCFFHVFKELLCVIVF